MARGPDAFRILNKRRLVIILMDAILAITYMVLGGLVVFLAAAIFLDREKRKNIELSDTMLASDELEKHAVEVARNHTAGRNARSLKWLLRRMNENFGYISDTYKSLNSDVKLMFPTAPAAEWLLDNFYIIEEQAKIIRKNLPKGYYGKLPVLKTGYLRGYPRVYAIALELVSHTDGRIDEKTLVSFLKAYQSQCMLSMGELWAVALMLRIALIENVRNICEKIMDSQQEWHLAERMSEYIAGAEHSDTEIIEYLKEQLKVYRNIGSSFTEHFLQKLRKAGRGVAAATFYLDGRYLEENTASEAVAALEHHLQAARQLSIGNTITGLKLVSDVDWSEIFESLSQVEIILGQDPAGVYREMDFNSRDYYRHEVEKLSRSFHTSEVNIARKAVDCAAEARRDGGRSLHEGHVGYYLIGRGRKCLMDRLGMQHRGRRRILEAAGRYPFALYICTVLLFTAFIVSYFTYYSIVMKSRVSIIPAILAALAAVIPSSELSLLLINTVLSHAVKPTVLPKLELKKGIPDAYRTLVIIPTLLPNEKRVHELLQQLELFYLGNKEENLYFALVGDFKDSTDETAPGDADIINTALAGISELNSRYGKGERQLFYYLHRSRTYNDRQGKWMGRERKRGAISDLTELLGNGHPAAFSTVSGNIAGLGKIKYVITLDADTSLPMGSARRLIGTIAHPLNSAAVNKKSRTVSSGYGLLQPRISVGIQAANSTMFTRIFAGQGGIDPYTTAVSDIYQDLFGEGIFTGKGIFDTDVFSEMLDGRIPDNAVLSHDLLEGCHLRTGLVTDIELIDGYPARYNSFSMRQHRWVRGDWQLLPWLFTKVRNRAGEKEANPLSALSKWKILDNMRRSLVNPSLLLLFILGPGILPGSSIVWLSLALAAAASPLIGSMLNSLLSGCVRVARIKRTATVITGFKASIYQSLLLLAFVPYQAYLMLDAVIRTIGRVVFTHTNLLEWVTAADVEASLTNDLKSFWKRMWASAAAAAILVIEAVSGLSGYTQRMYYNQAERMVSLVFTLLLAILWLSAPYAAYRISKPHKKAAEKLLPEEIQRLRSLARKTWRYFEDFAVKEDNYMPPDNYQEDPPRGAAHRTSPTNIGLLLASVVSARDFGYIGAFRTAERLEHIIAGIEKMEKWKGHLYNWYNTITLDTMRPLYVSTVDSGNYAGYLMAVRYALEGYLNESPVSVKLVHGLKDTVSLFDGEERQKGRSFICEELDVLLEKDKITLGDWQEALSSLRESLEKLKAQNLLRGSYWGLRLREMAEELTREFELLYPRNLRDKTAEDLGLLLLQRAYEAEGLSNDALNSLINSLRSLIARIGAQIDAMEFAPLFDNKRQLFSIGFNVEDGHLSKSYYDLLASEARQTSYIAIARGEVDQKHWFRLSRKLVVSEGYRGLVSWTGTMFEYLMPSLLMKSFENTLLDETNHFVVGMQKKHARARKIPWGISESGYRAFDINLNYQYKAFGVPELGLKRGLGNDMVIAPYAAVLAVGLDPRGVLQNIAEFEKLGVYGQYGLYEAVDFTPSRLDRGSKYATVKSYMAHHQGMSLVALNNYINGNIMRERFHAEPRIRSAELLLQERIPERNEFTKEHKDESMLPEKKSEQVEGDTIRTFGVPDTVLPSVHLLSNGSYSLMITGGGSSASKNEDMEVTRWSRDFRDGSTGMFVFVQNINSNNAWSTTFEPFNTVPERYRVVFSPDKAEFLRRDGNIETYTEITVSPEDNAEVRRISFTNHSSHVRVLEVTSYLEVVLAPQEADSSHPAFSKLFVSTEFVREHGCLIAARRHRTEKQKPSWLMHVMSCDTEPLGEIQYETDRMKFIGRNRSLEHPLAMEPDQPLTNSIGSVLDPVMSLRRRIRLEPGHTVKVCFTAAVAETHKNALELAEKYGDFKASERAFELAWTRSQVEAGYLGLSPADVELYLELAPLLIFENPLREEFSEVIATNTKNQSDLWPFGISGDLPIMLVSVTGRDDLDLVYWSLGGHEYWRMRGLSVDLVILVEKENGYSQPVIELVRDAVSTGQARELLDRRGGVFIRSASVMNVEQVRLFYTAARLVVKGGIGMLREQLKLLMLPRPAVRERVYAGYGDKEETAVRYRTEYANQLQYFNGTGGFGMDGSEYVIQLNKGQNTPAPWSNVISNECFGFLVTEAGGGYAWAGNSRENKLTPWSNDPVIDIPGEVLYIRDDRDGGIWTVNPMPVRENEAYIIRHGFGYTSFEHDSHELRQTLTMFAAKDEPVKLLLLSLSNTSAEAKKLTLTYYVRPVLGTDDNATSQYIVTRPDSSRRILYAENRFSREFAGRLAFIAASEEVYSFTGDRSEFYGVNGSIANPGALQQAILTEKTGAGMDPCAVIQIKAEIGPGNRKAFVFMLGQFGTEEQIREAVKRLCRPDAAERALEEVKSFWHHKLDTVRIKTPDESMNILMNGWLLYQVIACRLWARSAFYQSGGAFGFRDQLQDVMAAAYSWPDLMKKQILLHSSRQFVEGDVQHWWHQEAGRGIRTGYSDDLLWLPYVACDYVERTGDYEILDMEAGYLESEKLGENEDERYEIPSASGTPSSVYEHCVRAIELSLRYGSHGIPLMGTGDWNDGMNTVGNKGRGESIWLGWFLCSVLKKFIPVCISRNDKKRAERYSAEALKIAGALEAGGWDGSWYRRAYFDDGTALGTAESSECRIDSIAQSWSVISGSGRKERVVEAMSAVEKYLTDYDEGIIKLLTPPFDEGSLKPGYIKGYVPGVRENGGQYTHAAAWVVMAFAGLGQGDTAWKLFHMINPINHSRTDIECSRYKVEPYVIAADVYAVPPNTGRGGWTWYTGAAGWLYRVGLEKILGLRKEGVKLFLDPCIPSGWDSFEITYLYENSRYVISVSNPDNVSRGVKALSMDGIPCIQGYIELAAGGAEHRIEVVMGSTGIQPASNPEIHKRLRAAR